MLGVYTTNSPHAMLFHAVRLFGTWNNNKNKQHTAEFTVLARQLPPSRRPRF